MKMCWINSTLLLSFELSAQINRDFLTLKPVVSPAYPPGTVHCLGVPTAVVDVFNPTTGKTWMDRNLGASQVATSSTDALAYGDLYQWGRFSDGHQCRTSGITSTKSTTDTPGHANFISGIMSPYDWRNLQNNNLWQGVSGVNNPCPSGYRLPTDAELNEERASWSTQNAIGAFGSPLKLTVTGGRSATTATLYEVGTRGYYWSSTIDGTNAWALRFSIPSMFSKSRGDGLAVRCIKD